MDRHPAQYDAIGTKNSATVYVVTAYSVPPTSPRRTSAPHRSPKSISAPPKSIPLEPITPTIVGYGVGAAASGNTISFTKASLPTLANNDYLVAFLRSSSAVVSADYACTGFARIGDAFPTIDGGGRLIGTYTHVVTAGSEPSTYTFTFTGTAGRHAGILVLVRGVNTVNPIAGTSHSSRPPTTTAAHSEADSPPQSDR